MATARITFKNENNKECRVLFGDSYRPWQQAYYEYKRLVPDQAIKLEIAKDQRWIGYSGLKWCDEKDYQRELDIAIENDLKMRGACTRHYKDLKFVEIKNAI